MHLHLLSHDVPTGAIGLIEALQSHSPVSSHSLVGPTATDAADLGHVLADQWSVTGRPDVLVAGDWLAGLAAQIATRDHGIPVVQRLYSPGRSRDTDRRRLEGAIARAATRVLAVCSDDVDQLIALGVRRRGIRVVPPGVDIDVFTDAGPSSAAADGRRIVACPSSDPAAIRRLLSILPSLPRCELVLLTTAANGSATANAVAELLAHHPVADRVRLVDTTEPEATAARRAALLRSADLVLATGDDQAELDLALQGMACGRPVVAHAVGALSDVVAAGVTGVLVATTSADALGDAVRGLLADDLSRETYGLAAVDRARAMFGWAMAGPALGRVVDEVGPEVKSGPVHADASP
jgi:D-inositol-3-phosphate glycosyltransferase